jgi:hypothetical protein
MVGQWAIGQSQVALQLFIFISILRHCYIVCTFVIDIDVGITDHGNLCHMNSLGQVGYSHLLVVCVEDGIEVLQPCVSVDD